MITIAQQCCHSYCCTARDGIGGLNSFLDGLLTTAAAVLVLVSCAGPSYEVVAQAPAVRKLAPEMRLPHPTH